MYNLLSWLVSSLVHAKYVYVISKN